MYKLKPLTVPFEKPTDVARMYHLNSIHYDTVNGSECGEDGSEGQTQLISRLEALIDSMTKLAAKRGISEELFTALISRPMSETSSVPCKLSKPTALKSYTGRFELICHCSGKIPFSVIALPDWFPEGVSVSGFEILLYNHSSLLLSNKPLSERYERAVQLLRQNCITGATSKTTTLSVVVRIIVNEYSEESDVSFYLQDYNKQMKSQKLSSEIILLRCITRLFGLEFTEATIDEIIAFSNAANDLLCESGRAKLNRYTERSSPFSKTALVLNDLP